jgi:hypothetical protein
MFPPGNGFGHTLPAGDELGLGRALARLALFVIPRRWSNRHRFGQYDQHAYLYQYEWHYLFDTRNNDSLLS